MEPRAFQDDMSDNYCFGCGRENEHGLQIRSYWSGQAAVCTWEPSGFHAAGPRAILNGGVIATIIDCHCVCTAIAAAYRAEGRAISSNPAIWYATASLQVTYLRPTPIGGPVLLRAEVTSASAKKTTLTCVLIAGGEERVRAEVIAVRVPATWAHPR